ncbi:MAG: hypothetical protein KBS81_06720, partial [Spirochaetales bacterium]|nr:hypothetical protein [Candidatus Physcosoma equi]
SYESAKYGDLISDVVIDASDDCFVLEVPEGIDAGLYIDTYQADIYEFVNLYVLPALAEYEASLAEAAVVEAAPVEAAVAEVAVVEAPAEVAAEVAEEKGEYCFDVYGYNVYGTYSDAYFDSFSETKGILVSEDIQEFANYEIVKYGSFLRDNVYIQIVDDGFVLTIPSGVDAGQYVEQYKADIYEYVQFLLKTAEENKAAAAAVEVAVETVAEEAPEVEETVGGTYSFDVYGFVISGSYAPAYFDSVSETKGIVYASDIMGFAAYENAKYGDLLNGVIIDASNDSFVLAYPEGIDASLYIEQYRADILEYITFLLSNESAVVEEPTPVVDVAVEAVEVDPAVEPVVVVEETPAVVEEAPTAEPAPEPAPEPIQVPAPIETVEVVVLTSGEEKPAQPASNAAEKVMFNEFKVKTSVSGGFQTALEDGNLGAKLLRGTMFVDAQNVIQIGTRVGLGARVDGSLALRPYTAGWGDLFKNTGKYLKDPREWNMEAAASAKIMLYGNFNRATMYAGAGLGYSITRNASYNHSHLNDVQVFGLNLKSGMFVDATVGMSIDLSEHFGVGVDLGYRYFVGAPAQEANVAVVLSYTL